MSIGNIVTIIVILFVGYYLGKTYPGFLSRFGI